MKSGSVITKLKESLRVWRSLCGVHGEAVPAAWFEVEARSRSIRTM